MLLEGSAKFPFDGSAGGAFGFVLEECDSMFALSAGEVELVVCRAIVMVTLECFLDDVLRLHVEGEGFASVYP